MQLPIIINYLGEDPGGFMNDGPEVADLFIGEIANVGEFQWLEGKTLSCLSKCCIDVLVRDTAASVERQGTVRRQTVRAWLAGWLSQSL